ncbi:Cro/C1-type HTH DNA-binding domain-containing protein [Nocardia amikacinitolerans]|nr:Cro/C1-type HTH DNA-binding domain-containing protein [Nocardia amikacinitolerans]MCP2295158.1 Cro/C1-type HTH DNA-binding domain-containing protein [Nocardia amikacinitolerans]
MVLRMDHLDEMVAERVQHVLAKRGVALNDLVKHTGMPAAVLRRRLAAQGSFTLCELARIAAFAGCRTAELIPQTGRR